MSRTITVKGVGKVWARPDSVVLTMALESCALDYEKAVGEANQQLQRLNESVMGIGFKRDAVKTTSFNVNTNYESEKDQNGNYHNVFRGFICRQDLKLEFEFEAKRLAQTLGAVEGGLAHPQLSVSFTVKDTAAVNEEVLNQAAANARQKAKVLCEASGVKLGELLTIDYNWGRQDMISRTRFSLADECLSKAAVPKAMMDMEFEPDDIKVSEEVTFVWEINCQ